MVVKVRVLWPLSLLLYNHVVTGEVWSVVDRILKEHVIVCPDATPLMVNPEGIANLIVSPPVQLKYYWVRNYLDTPVIVNS